MFELRCPRLSPAQHRVPRPHVCRITRAPLRSGAMASRDRVRRDAGVDFCTCRKHFCRHFARDALLNAELQICIGADSVGRPVHRVFCQVSKITVSILDTCPKRRRGSWLRSSLLLKLPLSLRRLRCADRRLPDSPPARFSCSPFRALFLVAPGCRASIPTRSACTCRAGGP